LERREKNMYHRKMISKKREGVEGRERERGAKKEGGKEGKKKRNVFFWIFFSGKNVCGTPPFGSVSLLPFHKKKKTS